MLIATLKGSAYPDSDSRQSDRFFGEALQPTGGHRADPKLQDFTLLTKKWP